MTKLLTNLFLKGKDINTPKGRNSYGLLAGVVGIICNLFLSITKFLVGYISKSIAITADAINNISDAGSSIVTLIGFKLSEKPADKKHPYGHARFEYITGLLISFVIVNIGFDIFVGSFKKIVNPEESVFNYYTIIVLVVSIVVKLWFAKFNKVLGKKINSKVLEATSVDSRNDCISTFAVLIAYLISYFFNINLDGYMGVIVALIIIVSGIDLIKETINPLLGQAPSNEMYDTIKEKILSYKNVLGVHDLIIHSYGPQKYFATAHLEMDSKISSVNCHDVLDKIERDIYKDYNINLVLHLDPKILDNKELDELRIVVKKILESIDPVITFHDFRLKKTDCANNLFFDIVVPDKFKYSDDELSKIINNCLKEEVNYNLYAVITVDKSYSDNKVKG